MEMSTYPCNENKQHLKVILTFPAVQGLKCWPDIIIQRSCEYSGGHRLFRSQFFSYTMYYWMCYTLISENRQSGFLQAN